MQFFKWEDEKKPIFSPGGKYALMACWCSTFRLFFQRHTINREHQQNSDKNIYQKNL